MSRFPRSYIQTSYFHIITQGINKSYIFQHHKDITFYIDSMYKINNEHNIQIIAYCIMNNHAHFLFKIKSLKDLSKFMQRLNTRYAIYYNNKYNRVGFVFRDRYKAQGIYSQIQLCNCIRYIYNNPVKAGMCKRIDEYPYSNYKNELSNFQDVNYDFIDIDDEKYLGLKDYINDFLIQNNITLADLKFNKRNLKNLIILLKDRYDISLRQIAIELNMSREMIRRVYKQ